MHEFPENEYPVCGILWRLAFQFDYVKSVTRGVLLREEAAKDH